MKKWMFAVVVAVAVVGSPVLAESLPQPGDHSPKKQSTPVYPYQSPAQQVKKSSSARLFELVSACLADQGVRGRRDSALSR